VAATGNDSDLYSTPADVDPVEDPADCAGAIAVSGVRADGSLGGYSNVGCQVTVAAPGGDATDLDTKPANGVMAQGWDGEPGSSTFGQFIDFTQVGTSMAAAHVSGEAALLVGLGADVATARAAIVGTTRPGPAPAHTAWYGAGLIDIAAAVDAVRGGPAGVPGPLTRGYRTADAAGKVNAFGDECFNGGNLGQVGGPVARPVVGMANTASGGGYWLVASDGGIFAFGDARFFGSTGGTKLNQPIVGVGATPTGGGYWLVASDGGIFAFGDARFFGSTGGTKLNQPIVGIAPTTDGGGYWLVASDGGIFAFGDARFLGSTGGTKLNQPIVGIAPTTDGGGYWLAASDGGIFTFGDARFLGSTGGIKLNQPIVGIAITLGGGGYWLVAADGGIFNFGNGRFYGASPGRARVVAVAPTPPPPV
jgi:hypothetical protein